MADFPSKWIEQARALLDYDPLTGIFRWKVSFGSGVSEVKQGDIAGWVNQGGHRIIGLLGRKMRAHRIAYAFVYGFYPKEIDHANGDPDDNRIANLRAASHSQNIANGKARKNNSSGKKGVHFHPQTGKWRARICADRRSISLGLHVTVEAAHAAYMIAAREYFGEFARAQ